MRPPTSKLFPYTTLFRSARHKNSHLAEGHDMPRLRRRERVGSYPALDNKTASLLREYLQHMKLSFRLGFLRSMLERRSEERRVGKECRCGWSLLDLK